MGGQGAMLPARVLKRRGESNPHAGNGAAGTALRARVSHAELGAYLAEHPGRSAAQIADALQAAVTGISSQLHRGKHTRYEHRNSRWYRRSR